VGCEPRTNELLAESLTDLAIWAGLTGRLEMDNFIGKHLRYFT